MSKRLPPLNALRVFDAAARHLSFTRAADELFVTQAAVSHQIKSLEDFLGLKLFRRRNRSLLLTEEGQSYFQDIKEIFSQLTEATRKLQARSAKGALTVSLLPSFAIQWLVPRLTSFNSAYPGIDVRIQAVDRQEDKLADDVDVAIFYGRGNWPGLRVEKLYAEYLLPVCSPLLLTGDKALKTPADLAQHTLLHDGVYAAQSTHLPLKVNMAGVIPAIFASSIILFPATITSWFGGGTGWNWLTTISLYLQPGQPLYVLLYASAIIFFCFFYTALVFNPRETADNLKKSGAFVPGIRPGEQTAKYIDKVMTRLTLVGALYITFICLIPEFMRDAMKVPFYFGGTSLLIVVVVIMDFMAQVQTLMMSSQYESALKKANLKGYGR